MCENKQEEEGTAHLKTTKYLVFGTLAISVFLIAYILEIHSIRKEILNFPTAEEIVQCPNDKMTTKDCFLFVGVPSQNNTLTSYLVLQKESTLIFIVYFFSGIFGAMIYYVVLLYKPEYVGIPYQRLASEFASRNFYLRLLLSGISGILIYLLIWATRTGLGPLLPSFRDEKSGPSMENFIIMPILSGLFLSLFFQGARSAFNRFFLKKGE